MDLFDKINAKHGPLKDYAASSEGYYMFPKLEGEIGPRMKFNGKEVIMWSINDYLGLSNDPEVRRIDAASAKQWGLAYPMGSRMMSGHTDKHEQFQNEIAEFQNKEAAFLLNYGYQGVFSIIQSLVDRHDVIVYDYESHACIVDGVSLHLGKRFVYDHNDIPSLRKALERAQKVTEETGGAILVISEGVFGMRGDQGKLKEIVALKKEFDFRIFIDDAHGFGTLGPQGQGTSFEQGVQDQIDIYFATFAKSFASIGAYVASTKKVILHLQYTMRSQIFAKSLPMPMVEGALYKLKLLRETTAHKDKLWTIVNALQKGLKDLGYNIGITNSAVTPVYLKGSIDDARMIVEEMREKYGVFTSMVAYPVIPKGMIILRIIPTASHTMKEVDETLAVFEKMKPFIAKVAAGSNS
ncbi:MAG TPA: aminotransferase class I/II-fold pyridoxal phosphate-dependent enzyme [Saprospiraceae bacterium]|nr:aminotransferase class I/II-fold pyridoxal phosphate-dependent enzyme [Saprospiraceae bacterium]